MTLNTKIFFCLWVSFLLCWYCLKSLDNVIWHFMGAYASLSTSIMQWWNCLSSWHKRDYSSSSQFINQTTRIHENKNKQRKRTVQTLLCIVRETWKCHLHRLKPTCCAVVGPYCLGHIVYARLYESDVNRVPTGLKIHLLLFHALKVLNYDLGTEKIMKF